MRRLARAFLRSAGYEIRRVPPAAHHPIPDIPDGGFYRPLFSPWLGFGEFARVFDMCKDLSLVSSDRCYVLYSLALQALSLKGDFYECGVYKGGTAKLLADLLESRKPQSRKLHLFDTFEGMPGTDPTLDRHRQGDFSDTSIDVVQQRVGQEDIVKFHQGFIPDTFAGLEDAKIAFAHVDVDLYQSVIDCCSFIWPRLAQGGFMVFDDYGFPSCPGARKAVDEFFEHKQEVPLVLPTGQAVVFASQPTSVPFRMGVA